MPVDGLTGVMTPHRTVQAAAKDVLAQLPSIIHPDSTEESIAAMARGMLSERGFGTTWYHDCLALVLLGEARGHHGDQAR